MVHETKDFLLINNEETEISAIRYWAKYPADSEQLANA